MEKTQRNKRANQTGTTKFPDLKTTLAQFVRDRRNSNRAVIPKMIRRHAIHIAKERGLKEFVGGSSWCHHCMKRAGLSIRTTVGQRLPDDWENIMASSNDFMNRKIKRLKLNNDKVINMGEVPVTFDTQMTRTTTTKGDKTVTTITETTGHEKTSFKVVLAC